MILWTMIMAFIFLNTASEETFLTGGWAPESFKFCGIVYLIGMIILYFYNLSPN